MKKQLLALIIFGFGIILSSCSEKATEPDNKKGNLESKTITDLAADVSAKPGDPATFTYFNFTTGDTVAASEANAINWDIAFSQTTIKTNENCTVLVLEQTDFSSLLEAPASGYATYSKISWYSYNQENHQISPIPGVILVFKTSNGKYAKMKVISYYKGNPVEYSQELSVSRYYTFEYVYQPDGTRDF